MGTTTNVSNNALPLAHNIIRDGRAESADFSFTSAPFVLLDGSSDLVFSAGKFNASFPVLIHLAA